MGVPLNCRLADLFWPFTTIPTPLVGLVGSGAPPAEAEVTVKVKLVLVPLKNFVPSGERFPMTDARRAAHLGQGGVIPERSARLISSLIEIDPEFASYSSWRRGNILPWSQRTSDD